MEGDVTQSRTYYNFDRYTRFRTHDYNNNSVTFEADKGNPIPLLQTTTSFRSGSDSLGSRTVNDLLADHYNPNKPVTDTGHEFRTEKQGLFMSHSHVDYSYGPLGFHGPIGFLKRGEFVFPKIPDFSSNDVKFYGTKAISNTLPTKSAASLAQFLGELREGLPRMVGVNLLGVGKSPLKSIGGEYLNYQFGIQPLISDLKKFAKAVKNSSRIIKQYERDSGRVVRRRTGLHGANLNTHQPQLDLSDFDCIGILAPPYDTRSQFFWNTVREIGGSIPSQVHLTDSINRKVWFSGAYSYYLNSGDDVISRMDRYEQLANKLLGTRLTLDVLYQLAPWSWLIDWYADIGDIITSASAFTNDRLVLRYGYLMVTTVAKRQLIANVNLGPGFNTNTATEFRTTRKERFRASPYGFALSPENFSDGQWAILAALGMTKSPRGLK